MEASLEKEKSVQNCSRYLGEEEVSVYDISDVGHLDLNVLDIVARVSGVGERPLVDQHTGRLQPLPRTGTAGAVIDVQLDTGLVHVMWIEGRQIKVITSRRQI